MGTTYSITLTGRVRLRELQKIKAAVELELANISAQMSLWQTESEISRFNRFQPLEHFPASYEFAKVVERALRIAEITDGAFDPTVKPLIDFWGFGSGQKSNLDHKEASNELARIMQSVGWKNVGLSGTTLYKKDKHLQLDLSAIAKGYGVDTVADKLRSFDQKNFLVEIGGEIVVSGHNRERMPWRVGIEAPNGNGIFRTLELSGRAMATSGDYRNFRTREDGTHFSHIIDPKTGKPAETDSASVSILADSCMDADAIATALFVMGSKKSFQWLETQPKIDAFIIIHSTKGTFTTRATDGFPSKPAPIQNAPF